MGSHTQHGWELEDDDLDESRNEIKTESSVWPSTMKSENASFESPNSNANSSISLKQYQSSTEGTVSDLSSNDGSPPPTDHSSDAKNIRRRKRKNRRASVRVRFEINKEKEKQLQTALNMAKKKSLKKCIKYLINEKYLADSPRDVVNWIRLNLDQLEEEEVGEYLGI